MQIIAPHFIFTPHTLLENHAVLFEKEILKIAPLQELQREFPHAKTIQCKENSLLIPGLINAHVHLEFSANKTTLHYGDFMKWLYSVMQKREELIGSCQEECIQDAITMMLHNGITTFGAISSYGIDLLACGQAKQNVLFFNELIGSQPAMVDALFGNFLSRLEESKEIKREGFFPAIAIHSPYSLHPILLDKALKIAKEEQLLLTTHFMESSAEREWLDANEGDFKGFFEKLLSQKSATTTAMGFLSNFKESPTLFTHATKADTQELEFIASHNHTIIHCPISNRLLGNGLLNLPLLLQNSINFALATDGLSSNYKLDLFEEMRVALFMHHHMPLLELANLLFKSATCQAAKALRINTGSIEVGKLADMLLLQLDEKADEHIALHLILHHYKIEDIYIRGEKISLQ